MVDSKQQWKAWLYLAPAIVLLLVFTVYPLINTARLAFLEDYNALSVLYGAKFNVGIKNFISIWDKNEGLLDALFNTILLAVLTVPVSTILALLIAVALNSIKRFQKLLQTIYFLPYVTNSIAIGMVFAAMFKVIGYNAASGGAENWGIINVVLGTKINWINDSNSNYWANIAVMVIYIVWNALPFKILILLGGLQSISTQYYDAAKVDGTPRWRVLLRVTVPLLSPMLAYVIITGFIGAFKEYSSIVGVFSQMGPKGDPYRLQTMVGYIYTKMPNMDYGVSAAAALVLFAIILVVTLFNSWLNKKLVHY